MSASSFGEKGINKGEVVRVVENQKPVCSGHKPLLHTSNQTLTIPQVHPGTFQEPSEVSKAGKEVFIRLRPSPEYGSILSTIAIGIFSGSLRFTKPAKTCKCL